MTQKEELICRAKIIINAMAFIVLDDGSILVVNLNQIHYRLKMTSDGRVICSNMGKDKVEMVKRLFEKNKMFLWTTEGE